MMQLDNYNVTHCAGAAGFELLVAEIWPWVDAGVYSFIPLVVIVTLNSLIVRHVVYARRTRNRLSSFRSAWMAGDGHQQRRPTDNWMSAAMTRDCLRARSVASEQGQNARMIALLFAISFTFLAATLPRCAVLIAAEFIKRSLAFTAADADDPALYQARIYGSVRLAMAATDLLMYANHSVNFFLYCATGEKFRRQLCAVAFFVHPGCAPSSRMGGATTNSVGLRRRRIQRGDNILDDISVSQQQTAI